jgi:transcription elongation GreA/GreB family factor
MTTETNIERRKQLLQDLDERIQLVEDAKGNGQLTMDNGQ